MATFHGFRPEFTIRVYAAAISNCTVRSSPPLTEKSDGLGFVSTPDLGDGEMSKKQSLTPKQVLAGNEGIKLITQRGVPIDR